MLPSWRLRAAVLIGLVAPLVALVPLGRIWAEWWQVRQTTPEAAERITARSADWVRWTDADGQIVAQYVFPRGPAAMAGLEPGDHFYALQGQILFGAADLERTVASAGPGVTLDYEILRDGQPHTLHVTLTRHPTFLYPFSASLWAFALWGFVVGAFLHLVGLVVAYPLARQSSRARFALLLIGVSGLWIFANLARLLLVELFGPPGSPGGASDTVFQTLTVTGLAGWILFPAAPLLQRAGARARRTGAAPAPARVPARCGPRRARHPRRRARFRGAAHARRVRGARSCSTVACTWPPPPRSPCSAAGTTACSPGGFSRRGTLVTLGVADARRARRHRHRAASRSRSRRWAWAGSS